MIEPLLPLLRPHQAEPVKRLTGILSASDCALDFSDTGTGKTYVACAVAKLLKLPTLVVAPKISLTAWHRVAEHFGDTISTVNYEMLRTGRTPFGHWDNNPPVGFAREEFFVCQCCQRPVDFENYQPCYCHPAGFHCLITKKKRHNYGKFNFHPAVKLVIFDEVHRCGEADSLNDRMLVAAKDRKILALSATAATSPLKMRALGYVAGLHNLTPSQGLGFTTWAYRQGCRLEPQRGLQWRIGEAKQLEVMDSIRASLSARTVRVCTKDIPGFPERDITAELYDLDAAGQIDKLYAEMTDPLAALAERMEHDVAPDSAITKILRARQKIELLKVPIAVELAQDYLAKGYSVALFVNFQQTVAELARRLNCAAIIDGTPAGVRNRQQHIDDYQCNKIRLIICNNEAGGISVSLQDLDGNHPRVGIVFPNFSAVSMRQVFGRLHREGGRSRCHYRVIFAAKTVEIKSHRALTSKLNNLDALTDGDLTPVNLKLTTFRN